MLRYDKLKSNPLAISKVNPLYQAKQRNQTNPQRAKLIPMNPEPQARKPQSPLILLCNDDGIGAPGLVAAAEALTGLGDLCIVAPRHAQSAMGRSHPQGPTVGAIQEMYLTVAGTEHVAYAVDASPALTCAHGLLELCHRTPDLCVSGINYGENYGYDLVSLSGTLGVAFEAAGRGIPAMATSLEVDTQGRATSPYADMNWGAAMHFTRQLATHIINVGMPKDVAVLNLNVPADASPECEVRKTTQSAQQYYRFVKPSPRDLTAPLQLDTTVALNESTLEPDSDIQAVVYDRVVSITPLGTTLTAATDWQPDALHD
jgi:5'-nucleotidase